MMLIKLKLELPESGGFHRFRTTDPYNAWQWCVELVNSNSDSGPSESFALEDIKTGLIFTNSLEFTRYVFNSSANTQTGRDASHELSFRLKIAAKSKLIFRLTRDVSERSLFKSESTEERGSESIKSSPAVQNFSLTRDLDCNGRSGENGPVESTSALPQSRSFMLSVDLDEEITTNHKCSNEPFRLARDTVESNYVTKF